MAAAQTMAMTTTQKIIAIAVTIIIITTVAIPTIGQFQDDLYDHQNNSSEVFAMASATDSVSTTVTLSDGKVVVGGYVISPAKYSFVMFSDTFVVNVNSLTPTVLFVGVGDEQYQTTSVSVANKTITFTDSDSNNHSISYSNYLFYASENGKYGHFANTQFKVNSDSLIYYAATGAVANNAQLSPTSVNWNGVLKGTIGNVKSAWCESMTEGVSITEIVANIPYEDNGDGSYTVTVSSVPCQVSTDLGIYRNNTTANMGWLAPIEYYTINDTDAGYLNLFNVVMIMLILVPVMMAVRMITLKRN